MGNGVRELSSEKFMKVAVFALISAICIGGAVAASGALSTGQAAKARAAQIEAVIDAAK